MIIHAEQDARISLLYLRLTLDQSLPLAYVKTTEQLALGRTEYAIEAGWRRLMVLGGSVGELADQLYRLRLCPNDPRRAP